MLNSIKNLKFLLLFLNITYFSKYFCLVMQKKKIEIGFLHLVYRANFGFPLLPTACRLPTAFRKPGKMACIGVSL